MARAARPAARRPQHRGRPRRRPRLQRPRLLRRRRSTPPTSTRSAAGGSASPTSTRRRCARRPGPRCSRGATRTRPASAPWPTSTPASPATRWSSGPDVATIAELLRDEGYSTLMVGKWHLAKDSDCSASGPQHSWPCQRGFDRFYGILDAFTNLHHPHRIVEDNHLVDVDRYPDGYYFTDDLTDHAISMIRERKASNPEKPFFLYFAHGAVHAPLHAKPRTSRSTAVATTPAGTPFASSAGGVSRSSGSSPTDLPLPPRNAELNHDVQAWDDLTDREQRAVRPPHGGVRGDGRQRRPEPGPAARRARRDGRARQHHRDLHLRQRRVARGRAASGPPRTTCICSRATTSTPTTRASTSSAGRRPPRTTRAAGRWRATRRGGSTRSTPTPAATPFRSCARGRRVWADQADRFRGQYAHVTDLLPTFLDLRRRSNDRRSATGTRCGRSPGRACAACSTTRPRRPGTPSSSTR